MWERISQKSPETNAKLKTFAPFFSSFRVSRSSKMFFFFLYCVNILVRYLPNIFLAHKSVDYDYLASFLVMNCLDDPDGTFQIDAVDFVQPKLLAVQFPTHLVLRWMVRPIIQHKPLLNLPNDLVDHPMEENREKKKKNKSQVEWKRRKKKWFLRSTFSF